MKRLLLFPTLSALLLLPATLRAQEGANPPQLSDQGEGYENLERFIDTLETVRQNHPDGDKVSYERLINYALEGMLGSLDKHSGFYHPASTPQGGNNQNSSAPELNLPSLGLTLAQRENEVYLFSLVPNSTAAQNGLSVGDTLLSVGEEETLNLQKAHQALQGEAGQHKSLTLRRKSDRETYSAQLTHRVLHADALGEAFLLADKKTGYLYLRQFTATAHREIEAALDELEDQGMKQLILDLRGNPGGLLHISVQLLGEFLPPNTEVVFTKGRNPAHSSEPMKTPARQRKKRDYPLVVLIDKGSASASELVSGALQDLKRATVIGQVSYGKGSVQQIIPKGRGTALRLTIAKYHTPSGRTPHEVGITPDLPVEISQQDAQTFTAWLERRSAPPEKKATLNNWPDPVLKAALKHLNN